jgi:hypothetical protein
LNYTDLAARDRGLVHAEVFQGPLHVRHTVLPVVGEVRVLAHGVQHLEVFALKVVVKGGRRHQADQQDEYVFEVPQPQHDLVKFLGIGFARSDQ